ncbi:8-oxo-dGTP diphosphatase [Lipingzhangella halophila]|uniref:8-oxo-dGTP diphosphatase n=1 Tax=Lipingzhangella halophila TaxID=1783352 RepID=A0A7W7RD76_9ACTN|nr:NUDIX hydrolase [Lipingzhangella halophila]MBB4929483.1 8-oxo-dGTP diphosphatase [Lipingzhangella halophila]
MAERTESAVADVAPSQAVLPGGYVEPIRSAGAVLWRGTAPQHEVALIHRPHRGDWTLPKGKVKRGEHLLTTAAREVTEETGHRPVLGRRLPPQRYLRNGWPKQVEWWAATACGESSFTPNDEVDAVEWLPLATARARLSYPHDVEVLDSFARGPAETFPLVLFRHASAREKRTWEGNDLLRPLNDAGRTDALAAARVLSSYGALRVVSSAAARCTESVLPFAVEHDTRVRTDRALTAPPAGNPESVFDHAGARAVFGRLLDEGSPTIVCTHGELVSDLMRGALEQLGAPVSQQLALRKGTFWVLHVSAAERALAAVERHSVRG